MRALPAVFHLIQFELYSSEGDVEAETHWLRLNCLQNSWTRNRRLWRSYTLCYKHCCQLGSVKFWHLPPSTNVLLKRCVQEPQGLAMSVYVLNVQWPNLFYHGWSLQASRAATDCKILNLRSLSRTYCSFCATMSSKGPLVRKLHILGVLQVKNNFVGMHQKQALTSK